MGLIKTGVEHTSAGMRGHGEMGVRIETRWTDKDGDAPPRVHVIVNGQDCGPSFPCEVQAWLQMRDRFEKMLQHACDRSYGIGQSNAQAEMRRVLGVK